VISIPIFAASIASVSLITNNIALFYLAWVVVPLCGIGAWPISYLKATSGWFDRRLGFALGLTNTGIGIGAAILPVIVGAIIANYGWRSAYVCLGALSLFITWPVALLWLRENRGANPAFAGPVAGANELDLRGAFRTRTFWISAVAFALLGILNVGMLVHMVKIFSDEGLSAPTAVYIMSTLGIALIIGRVGTGWLLDRFTAASIMAIIVLGSAAACVAMAVGAASIVAVAAGCAFLIGVVIGAEFDVLSYMIPRYWGRKAFGRIYGVTFAVFQGAAGLGAAGLGFSRGAFGTYAPALWALAGLMLICALLFSILGPYRCDPRRSTGSERSAK
jgi:MFS family permease